MKVKKSKVVSFIERKKVSMCDAEVPYPEEGYVLVRMMACGICQFDIKCYKDIKTNPVYSSKPGHEGVGIVEAIGNGVEDIKPGDKITSNSFGGSFADYFIAHRDTVVCIPDEVQQYEQWISEPLACLVNSLRQLKIEPGDDVAVLGSGYMGLLFVQGLPKEFINNLIAIDIDQTRLKLAKKFGATAAINAHKDDPVEAVLDTAGRKVDIVIEAVGEKGVISQATDMLKNAGRLCIFGHHAEDEVVPTDDWHMKGLEVLNTTPFSSRDFKKDLVDAVKLMIKGTFHQKMLITHTYSFNDFKNAISEVSEKPSALIKAVVKNY